MKKLTVTMAFAALCVAAVASEGYAAGKLTDSEIAKIVVTANTAEVDAGKMANQKSTNPEVKSFAEDMIKVHEQSNKDANELAKKSHMAPKESSASRELSSDAKQKMTALEKANGKDFDRAYVQSQVDMHKQVLASIDNDLLPNAKNKDLKSMLEKTRPVVAEHLAHAEHLLTSLSSDMTTK